MYDIPLLHFLGVGGAKENAFIPGMYTIGSTVNELLYMGKVGENGRLAQLL